MSWQAIAMGNGLQYGKVTSEELKSQSLKAKMSESKAKSEKCSKFQEKHLSKILYLDGSMNRTRTIKIRLNKHHRKQ